MNTNALFGAGAVPLIAGIIQVFKATGVPARLAPAIALVLGIGAGLLSVWQTQSGPEPWAATVVLGVTWGLAASGLYQGGKLARTALRSTPNPYPGPGTVPPSTTINPPPPPAK